MSEYKIVLSDDDNSNINIRIEVVEGKAIDLVTRKFDNKEFDDLTEAEIALSTVLFNLVKERNVIDTKLDKENK